jgi:hypothetical protein
MRNPAPKQLRMKKWTIAAAVFLATLVPGAVTTMQGQLHWPGPPKKTPIRVRLVAVAWADPRSSFFSNHEVFVAETDIGDDEWKLIKLVFSFLPYQPRLLQSGFDYSLVHEVLASRDTECDETIADLTARQFPVRRQEPLVYARDVPKLNLDRRRIPLPCYETNADDYAGASYEPPPPQPGSDPALKERAGEE